MRPFGGPGPHLRGLCVLRELPDRRTGLSWTELFRSGFVLAASQPGPQAACYLEKLGQEHVNDVSRATTTNCIRTSLWLWLSRVAYCPKEMAWEGAGGEAILPALSCSRTPVGLPGCCQHQAPDGMLSFSRDFCAHSVWAALLPQGGQRSQGTPDDP